MLMLRLLVLMMLLCPAVSLAQSIDYYDLLVHNNRTVVSDGSNVPVDRANTVVFEVNVTGTAEVLFRISGPGRFAWQSLSCTPSDSSTPVTSTSTNGLFTCNVAGGEAVSARLDTCTACTASVSIRRSTAILGNGGAGGGGGSTGWPTTRVGNITFANSFVNAAGIGDGTDYWAPYRDPTTGLQFNCVVLGVENACNYIRKLAAGFYFEIQNASGTSIFRVTNDTGAITNATFDTEGTGNSFTYKRYLWRPFAACQAGTASTIWDLPSSNAPTPACKGSTTTKGVLEFADGATDLSTTIIEYLNEDWSGAIDATILWESTSTSTNNVLWGIAIACAGPGDNSDPSFTDDDFTADANNGTASTYNATSANAVTTTGSCTAGDLMHIRVTRRLSQAGDTFAATAQALGLSLKLREAQ